MKDDIYYLKNGNINRLYRIYNAMIHRCYDQNRKGYKNYGGRGIKVCDEWLNDFNTFVKWSLENGYVNQANIKQSLMLSIDRIDNDKNYCPENCQWITIAENTKKAHKGKITSEETKHKMSISQAGKHHTEETKKKLSDIKKEYFSKNKGTFYGKHHSEEAKRKISESKKGNHIKPFSDLHKQKISDSQKKRKVICLTTNEVFISLHKACDKYNISLGNLWACCNERKKTCGKLEDGTPLKWMYYDECVSNSKL